MKDRPWFNTKAVQYFQDVLNGFGEDSAEVFEWGVGGTTALLSAHKSVKSIITIDNDPRYIRMFQALYPKSKADIRLVALGRSYPIQMNAPKDVIIVDGRMRVECFRNAVKKVKPGGVLILDDSQRDRYSEVFSIVPETWERTRIYGPGDGGWWETAFFFRGSR
jgi:spermidine synthase